MKLLKTYKKASKYFIKPKLKFGFCKWWNLPVMEYSVTRSKPTWLKFGWCCYDIWWKDKYGTPRFEYPPALIITLFGYSFWCKYTYESLFEFEDDIWECILEYVYYLKHDDLYQLMYNCGRTYDKSYYLTLEKCFLKKDYSDLYDYYESNILKRLDKEYNEKI